LIVVVGSKADREAVMNKAPRKDDAIHLSIVALDDLEQLQLPI